MYRHLVSIIIPVYNSEKYLAETISSALNQTWPRKEVIIVDDGSTDGSLALAQSFASDIIKVFHQNNRGASAARNKGMQEAQGDYIQFLDGDDLLDPHKIDKQMRQLEGNADTLSICPVVHFYNSDDLDGLNPSEYELSFYNDNAEPFEFLLKLYGAENNMGGMIPIHSWLTPANVIKKAGNWNEELTLNDDGEFFCRVVLQAYGIIVERNSRCYYRKHNSRDSLSAKKNSSAFYSQLKSIQLIEDHLKRYKDDVRINKAIARILTELLFQAYPGHLETASKIEKKIKSLGGLSHHPTIGGSAIEAIKKLFGWKLARKLQYYNPFK